MLSSPSQGTTGCSRLDVKTQGCKTPEIEVRDDVLFGTLMYWSSVGPMLSVRQLRSHRNNSVGPIMSTEGQDSTRSQGTQGTQAGMLVEGKDGSAEQQVAVPCSGA